MDMWVLKYKYLYHKFYTIQKLKRLCFCKFGFHEILTGSQSIVNCNKQEVSSEYVRCANCNVHWFPTKEHKDNYLRINESKIHTQKHVEEIYKSMYGKESE